MKVFCLVIAALFVACEAKNADRSALNFQSMISYTTGRSALAFNGYGNWCGLGPYFSTPATVDKIDECCRSHDNCYSDTGCNLLQWEVLNPYDWHKNSAGRITCDDAWGTCDRANCECDRVAAECFASYPYNCDYAPLSYKLFC
ncbi:phospholipase A21 precursor [Trichoplax adhaerens]|uniref:Phospholipase A2 n=1 Tax=Trichoplax adhaerens TaxID=10228 RepID=B3S7T4_TRIAD|nr:phospholipase A21 precursor [Trichoplax adhaerens]EDV21348.1 phospholipase A21 precursor [Trichoplax adhaerens]|eukprot:XP_002116315.1 phospholipase A21 precursor [Trichoplax adhaerens]